MVFRGGLFIATFLVLPALWAGIKSVQQQPLSRTDQQLLAGLEQHLESQWSQLNRYSDQEKLSLALAYIVQQPGFSQGVTITDEMLAWYKSGEKAITTEHQEQLVEFAKSQIQKQMSEFLSERRVTHSNRTVMFPVGKEIIKGSLAAGAALFSVWMASSGQHIPSEDWMMALRAFSLMATMYTLYRPFKILKVVTEYGQVDQLRLTQIQFDEKFGPVPPRIWQTWLLLRQLSDHTQQNWSCVDFFMRR